MSWEWQFQGLWESRGGEVGAGTVSLICSKNCMWGCVGGKWRMLPGKASWSRAYKSCGVWSPGVSGVWVAAKDYLERLQQENPNLDQRLGKKTKNQKETSLAGQRLQGEPCLQLWSSARAMALWWVYIFLTTNMNLELCHVVDIGATRVICSASETGGINCRYSVLFRSFLEMSQNWWS